ARCVSRKARWPGESPLQASCIPMSPLRRFQATRVEPHSRRRDTAASRDVHCAPESCRSRRTGPVGLARSHHDLVVSDGPMWCPAAAGPLLLTEQGSSSPALHAPSEYRLAFACPRASPPRAPSLGSHPSSRHPLEESTHRRASRARLRSAPSVSHALDGLL